MVHLVVSLVITRISVTRMNKVGSKVTPSTTYQQTHLFIQSLSI